MEVPVKTEELNYQKAPIREAILDVRVRFPKPIAIAALQPFHEAVKKDYPGRQARLSIEANISIPLAPQAMAGVTSPVPKEDGYLSISADGKQVAQARLDGFTFNRMPPYDKWDTFCGEAKRLWPYYVAVAKDAIITRVALRYINAIQVPVPGDFRTYVRTIPTISPDLPQDIQTFFMRLVLPFPKVSAEGIIIETIEPATEGKVTIIFDIDVYKTVSLPITSDLLWTHFNDLRKLKNEIFENSTTAAAKELFK
jgi:uncharacterized protein (TIGR04255 family)